MYSPLYFHEFASENHPSAPRQWSSITLTRSLGSDATQQIRNSAMRRKRRVPGRCSDSGSVPINHASVLRVPIPCHLQRQLVPVATELSKSVVTRHGIATNVFLSTTPRPQGIFSAPPACHRPQVHSSPLLLTATQ